MPTHSLPSPIAFLATGWRYRRLIGQLAWRRIEARYRGSWLGILWSVFNPLFLLCIYTFIFGFVFQAKWDLPIEFEGRPIFALLLFSGIILFYVFSECLNEAPDLIVSNRTFLKQYRFPLEVLPWVSLTAALFNLAMSFALLFIFYFAILGSPPPSVLLLPLVLVPLALLSLGLSWLISSLGVFLRDLSHLVRVLTTALLFMSPIFYPASRIPEPMRELYFLNPLALIIQMSKQVLFLGTVPDWRVVAVLLIGTWLIAWLGHTWFMRSKGGFADVL